MSIMGSYRASFSGNKYIKKVIEVILACLHINVINYE